MFVWIINPTVSYHVDVSEGIGINKTNVSKECAISRYWYFLHKGFQYELCLCHGCYNLMEKATNFDDVDIFFVKRSDYRIHFWYMSKDDPINIRKNSNLNEKS